MNEIEKLKTENARYKEALTEIHDEFSEGTSFYVGGRSHHAYVVADRALNPPPVTLEASSITFFFDGSISWKVADGDVRAFGNSKELFDFFNARVSAN